jgi:undecaprenyl-diphosphatase
MHVVVLKIYIVQSMLSFMGIDLLFHDWMQAIESSWLTHFSEFIAVITEPIVLLVVSLIIGLLVYFYGSKKKGLFFPIMILITGVLIKVSKWSFQRARPLDSLILEIGYSLPSGHATAALVFFSLVGYLFWKKGLASKIFLPLMVLLIGFTRLYLRVHWLTDVLAGYVLGAVILLGGISVYRKIKSS